MFTKWIKKQFLIEPNNTTSLLMLIRLTIYTEKLSATPDCT